MAADVYGQNHYARKDATKLENYGVKVGDLRKMVIEDQDGVASRHLKQSSKCLEDAVEKFDSVSKGIFEASEKMHAQQEALAKRSKDAVGKLKDQAAQLADAMTRVSKVLGHDFEKRLDQLENLTSCLERLNTLNQTGKLKELLEVLSSK